MSPRPLSNVVPAITESSYNQQDHIKVITYHGNWSTSLHQVHLCSKLKRPASPTPLVNYISPLVNCGTRCWETSNGFHYCSWRVFPAQQHKWQLHSRHVLGARNPHGCHGRRRSHVSLGEPNRPAMSMFVAPKSTTGQFVRLRRHGIIYPDASHSSKKWIIAALVLHIRGMH